MNKCIRNASGEHRCKLLGYINMSILLYEDTAVLLAKKLYDLQCRLQSVSGISTDLKINVLKNKTVVFENKNEVNDCKYYKQQKLKQIDEFLYLDRIFTKDRKMDRNILLYANAGRKVMGKQPVG